MEDGESRVSMSKNFFWKMFKAAWNKSFTEDNIQHAFAKPGIWPIAPDQMLSRIAIPVPEPSLKPIQEVRTPKSSKAIRHFHLAWRRDPSTDKVEILFHTTQALAAKVSVLEHVNKGLRNAITLQKQKGQKGKRLNLCGEVSQGMECYSPDKVVDAREYHEKKEAEELLEAKAKEARKIQRAANALKNKQLKEEKEARQAAAQLAKDLHLANPAARKAPSKKPKVVVSKAKKAASTVSKTQKPLPKTAPAKKSVKKGVAQVVPAEEVVGEAVTANRRGRQIKLPTRFK
jgi:hypothetical protein